jgi:hypothetical protein
MLKITAVQRKLENNILLDDELKYFYIDYKILHNVEHKINIYYMT